MRKLCGIAIFLGTMVCGTAVHAQTPMRCPSDLPADILRRISCWGGQDDNGAYYLFAVPNRHWNGDLVIYMHGGPRAPAPITTSGGLAFLVASQLISLNYAVGATSYRTGDWNVSIPAADVDNFRQIFHNFMPLHHRRTILYGTSLGGLIGARTLELYPDNYDGLLDIAGANAGFARIYYQYLDLRVVYQYYCQNLPQPSETQYPLWNGLLPDDPITSGQLNARINECTGVQLPPAMRTQQQQANLSNILNVVRVPESGLLTAMGIAAFGLRNIVVTQTNGLNAFPNRDVVYQGSTDDAALNCGIARYDADPGASDALRDDSEPTGLISVPVVTVHSPIDNTSIVENEWMYEQTLIAAGTNSLLFQGYVDRPNHPAAVTSEAVGAVIALGDWLNTGVAPTADVFAADCAYAVSIGLGGNDPTCHVNTTFAPDSFWSRVYPQGRY